MAILARPEEHASRHDRLSAAAAQLRIAGNKTKHFQGVVWLSTDLQRQLRLLRQDIDKVVFALEMEAMSIAMRGLTTEECRWYDTLEEIENAAKAEFYIDHVWAASRFPQQTDVRSAIFYLAEVVHQIPPAVVAKRSGRDYSGIRRAVERLQRHKAQDELSPVCVVLQRLQDHIEDRRAQSDPTRRHVSRRERPSHLSAR